MTPWPCWLDTPGLGDLRPRESTSAAFDTWRRLLSLGGGGWLSVLDRRVGHRIRQSLPIDQAAGVSIAASGARQSSRTARTIQTMCLYAMRVSVSVGTEILPTRHPPAGLETKLVSRGVRARQIIRRRLTEQRIQASEPIT